MRRISRSALWALPMILLVAPTGGSAWAQASAAAPRALSLTPAAPLPLYQFAKTTTGPLPWNAQSLASSLGGATVSAGPLSTTGPDGSSVLAIATSTGSVGVLLSAPGAPPSTGTYTDLGTLIPSLPPPSDAPVPFFDGAGHLNVAYVGVGGDLYVATNDPVPGVNVLGRGTTDTHPRWRLTNLSALSSAAAPTLGVVTATGTPAINISGSSDLIAVRTPAAHLVHFTLSATRPFLLAGVTDLSAAVSPAITVAGNPVALGVANGTDRWAAVATGGHLTVFGLTGSSASALDVTALTKSASLGTALSGVPTSSGWSVAGIAASSGDVQYFSASSSTPGTWTNADVTTKSQSTSTNAPPLGGRITLARSGSSVTIAGQAAGWGDLFAFTSSNGTTWAATDVSATGGSNATTVGPTVSSLVLNGAVLLFAGGVATPAPQGVGIYDIPSNDLPHAVADHWKIIADTGGLGTTTAPYTNVWPSTPVNQTPEFVTGSAIANASGHPRETWLSFWTVSGPVGTESVTPATYQSHAYQAGAAVATEIDQYRNAGLGLKPDWVILDPEGFPDNHSELDGTNISSLSATATSVTVSIGVPTNFVTGQVVSLQFLATKIPVPSFHDTNVTITVTSKPGAPTTFSFPNSSQRAFATVAASGNVVNNALIAQNWAAVISGWRAGIAAVDPSLNAAIYTEESQYSSFGIAKQNIPVFMAIAYETTASPYTFTVTARNAGGSSPPGSVTTLATSTATAPTAPTNVRVVLTSNTTATVTWSAPSQMGSSALTGYTVRAYKNNQTLAGTCAVAATATSCTMTGLSNLWGKITSPQAISHSNNVLGYIEFGNLCVPGTVQSQMTMLQNAPFGGLYNTVQFNPPGYCTATTP